MKETGIVRRLDDLGRVVLPKELRDTLNLRRRDPIEIFVDGDRIILKKYSNARACMVTGEVSDDNLIMADGDIVLSPAGVESLMGNMQTYLEDIRKKRKSS